MRTDVVAGTPPRRGHRHLRTNCGRELTVGRLALGDDQDPAERVFVDLGESPGLPGMAWAGLTVTEARQLGRALLSEAAMAEREGRTEGGTEAGPAGRITVGHAGGDAYAISTRGHAVLVDQPEADGGKDAAATPTELLVASLSSCVAFYAGRYLLRHGLDRSGLAVTAEFTMARDRPARVGDVRLRISAPGLPPERRDALLAVASHCTVHNTMRQPPSVSITLD